MPGRRIIVSPQGGGTPIPPPPSSIQYPRNAIGSIGSIGAITPADSRNINYLRLTNLAVIYDQIEGAAAANGYNRGTDVVVPAQAGNGTTKPIVLQYVLPSYIAPSQFSGGTVPATGQNPIWGSQMNAMLLTWYLYNGGSHVFTADPPPSTNYAYNPCDNGPASQDSAGNNCEAAYARYYYRYFVLGNYAGQSAADAAPTLDGPWHDNIDSTWGGYFTSAGNFLGGATTYSGNDIAAMPTVRAGLTRFAQWLNANASSQIVVGNFANIFDQSDLPGVAIFLRAPSVNTSIYGAFGAGMAEAAWGPPSALNTIEHYNGFEILRKWIQYNDASVSRPEFNQYVHSGLDATGNDSDFPNGSAGPGTGGANGTPGQAARYSITGALCVGKGCHWPINSAAIGGAVATPGGWYDYYSVDIASLIAINYQTSTVAQVGAGKSWLNVPIDPVQMGGSVGNTGQCYARRFRMLNGRTVLVLMTPSSNNNPGAVPQTVNLSAVYGGSWTHITASASNNDANPMVNNGLTVTSVTVPVGDGVILVQ